MYHCRYCNTELTHIETADYWVWVCLYHACKEARWPTSTVVDGKGGSQATEERRAMVATQETTRQYS